MSEFAGTLRERILVERPIEQRTQMGLPQIEWEPFFRCLALVLPEGAGAEAEAMALSAMSRFRVTIRRREGVRIDQRVRWKDRILTIRQIVDDPRERDRLHLRCEEARGS